MVTSQIILIPILSLLFTSLSATQFIVGDDNGWTPFFDYQAWTVGKKFVVGDTLVFHYRVGKHNVFRANGTVFQQCIKPALSEALTSGHDVITLATPGNKYYICGVANHCAVGNQKLALTVHAQSARPARKLAAKNGWLQRVTFV